MTTKIVEDELGDLQSFASMVWSKPQAVLKQSGDVEFIDLQGFFHTFQLLFGPAVKNAKILVRDEYRTALQELETDAYLRGAYVTGQPGIGKTLFLIYILVAHLGQERPVALQFPNGEPFYALFNDTVNFYPLNDRRPLLKCGFVWVLSDSNQAVERPYNLFLGIPDFIRVVQTTSPEASRWKEWSKQTSATCYVMDFWSEEEIANLAKLLGRNAERMTTLAKTWGGIPRKLLEFMDEQDWVIELNYLEHASTAIEKCRVMISSPNDLPDDAPLQFYFVRPKRTKLGIVRSLFSICVPTPTLRRILGEALCQQEDSIKLQFFRSLSQPAETRQAAGYIFESWFHSFFSAARTIRSHWLGGLSSVIELQGTTTLVPSTLIAPRSARPPYYWVAPKGFPGIDSALVLQNAIYAFQVTLNLEHRLPNNGLQILRANLPDDLKDIHWWVVLVGGVGSAIERVADEYNRKKLFFPIKRKPLPFGWTEVDPVRADVTYRAFRDESDPLAVPKEMADIDVEAEVKE